MNGYWIDDQIESWVSNSDSIDDKEGEFLYIKFENYYFQLKKKKKLFQIQLCLWYNQKHQKTYLKNQQKLKFKKKGKIKITSKSNFLFRICKTFQT